MNKKKIINRLKRIEGQVRGLQNMIETDRNCNDLLTQLSAVQGAIENTAKQIIKEYAKNCITEYKNSDSDDEKIISNLLDIISKFKKI